MSETISEKIVALIVKVIGCGNCGRFGLYSESHDSKHTSGWVKLICPHCAHSVRFPVRGESE
jgi:RNase P subunit RPR2